MQLHFKFQLVYINTLRVIMERRFEQTRCDTKWFKSILHSPFVQGNRLPLPIWCLRISNCVEVILSFEYYEEIEDQNHHVVHINTVPPVASNFRGSFTLDVVQFSRKCLLTVIHMYSTLGNDNCNAQHWSELDGFVPVFFSFTHSFTIFPPSSGGDDQQEYAGCNFWCGSQVGTKNMVISLNTLFFNFGESRQLQTTRQFRASPLSW